MKNLLLGILFSTSAFGITANKVWRVPSGGTLPSWGPVNLADATNAVTGVLPKGNLPAVGLGASSSVSTSLPSNTAISDVTSLTVTINTTGRPVEVFLSGNGSSDSTNPSYITVTSSATTSNTSSMTLMVDGATVYGVVLGTAGLTGTTYVVPSSFRYIVESPVSVAGDHTFKIQASTGTNNTLTFSRVKIFAREL